MSRAPTAGTVVPGKDQISGVAGALKACALVSGLDETEIYDVAARSSVMRFKTNRRIFDEGDDCTGLWVLTRGRVRLLHLMADGRQHAVGFHAPTAAIDLEAAVDGRAYMTTAVTLTDSEFVFVPRPVLTQLAQDYPITIRNAMQQLCLEVRQRDITAAIAALKDARGRIGCTLLQLARQFGVQDGPAIRIDYPLTRQHIADRAGVTVETAIRVMSEMQQTGVVSTDNQIISILDIIRVREAINCAECQFECGVFAEQAGNTTPLRRR